MAATPARIHLQSAAAYGSGRTIETWAEATFPQIGEGLGQSLVRGMCGLSISGDDRCDQSHIGRRGHAETVGGFDGVTVVARSTAGSKTYLSDSSSNEVFDFGALSGAHETLKGGEKTMTFSEWIEFARANWKREEGQTMAEYGVVLAVITIGAVAVFGLLSGGITGAINKVIALLPK